MQSETVTKYEPWAGQSVVSSTHIEGVALVRTPTLARERLPFKARLRAAWFALRGRPMIFGVRGGSVAMDEYAFQGTGDMQLVGCGDLLFGMPGRSMVASHGFTDDRRP